MTAHVRLSTIEDVPAIRTIYAPYVTDSVVSFEMEVPSLAVFEERWRSVTERYPWLVACLDDEIVGYTYASPHRVRSAYAWSAESGIYLHNKARRQGFGKALYKALCDILRLQGFHQLYAGATLPNPSSVGLHEALGFSRIGTYHKVGYKHGAWRDVGWWGLALQAAEVQALPPTEPIPLPMLDTAHIEAAIKAANVLF